MRGCEDDDKHRSSETVSMMRQQMRFVVGRCDAAIVDCQKNWKPWRAAAVCFLDTQLHMRREVFTTLQSPTVNTTTRTVAGGKAGGAHTAAACADCDHVIVRLTAAAIAGICAH